MMGCWAGVLVTSARGGISKSCIAREIEGLGWWGSGLGWKLEKHELLH